MVKMKEKSRKGEGQHHVRMLAASFSSCRAEAEISISFYALRPISILQAMQSPNVSFLAASNAALVGKLLLPNRNKGCFDFQFTFTKEY